MLFIYTFVDKQLYLEGSIMSENNSVHKPNRQSNPVTILIKKIYKFLSSATLAVFLLIAILICCLVGVTVLRGPRAWELIFNTTWFNSILALLVINVACCFFGRIWRKKFTVVSFGMILFHLSFVVMFLAIVYNSFFYFRGTLRITEGETVANNNPEIYDNYSRGKLFNPASLKGTTSFIKLHTGYKVDGENKRAAYEISVDENGFKKHDIIYATHKLVYNGIEYITNAEGFSVLVTLTDRDERTVYGAHIPLQSYFLSPGNFAYVTGYKEKNSVKPFYITFPQSPSEPLFFMGIRYFPSKIKERSGDVLFQISPYIKENIDINTFNKTSREKQVAIGDKAVFGNYIVSPAEVRYWVSMNVSYDPGKPVILASLWLALLGIIITTIGRMVKRTNAKK